MMVSPQEIELMCRSFRVTSWKQRLFLRNADRIREKVFDLEDRKPAEEGWPLCATIPIDSQGLTSCQCSTASTVMLPRNRCLFLSR